MIPDLNRLKVFYFIYMNKSASGAAQELNVTQSAVSQHLRNLETDIKTKLFTRVHKRLVPTPAGEKLYDILKPFISDLENGIQEIQNARKGPCGNLRIGAPVGFGEKYLLPISASFRKTYPDVSFHLELGHPTILLPLVSEGRLDFAFADIFSDPEGFSRDLAIFNIKPVVNEELVLACSKSYYQEHVDKDHSVENLSKCQFMAYRKNAPAIRNWFRHHFNKMSVRLDVVLTVESLRAVITGIKECIGLGLVPAHFIKAEIDAGEIVPISTGKKEIVNRISIVQLLDKIPGPSEKFFLEHFTREIKDSVFRV